MRAEIYTDGSYNQEEGIYGCGAVLLIDGRQEERMYKTGRPPEGRNGWNVNGEIEAALMGIEKAADLGCREITVYHDYEGVGKWPDGLWKAKKSYTLAYAQKIRRLRQTLNIRFVHVKGHAGNKYNEIADSLAKTGAHMAAEPADIDRKEPDIAIKKEALSSSEAGGKKLSEGLNPEGDRNIRSFLKKENPSVKDYLSLKTGGADAFSSMSINKMEESLGREACQSLRALLKYGEDYKTALRWMMRGLSAGQAARKVEVDRMTADHFRTQAGK